MKRVGLFLICVSACAVASQTGENANLGIFVETRLMRIPGMKPFKMPKLPPGITLPAAARQFMPGSPTRSLKVKLWAPVTAPDDATATLAVPSGLQLGDKLNLSIYKPAPPSSSGAGGGTSSPSNNPSQPPDFTIKIYWGSSATVRDGQPKVFSLANLTSEGRSVMMSRMSQMRMGGASMTYRDHGTTAFWPGTGDSGEIKDEATMPGTYTVNSSFAGSSTVEAPSGVDFLAPIEITSPNLDQKVALDGPLAFQWNQIPNCLGQYATAFGMQDKNTLILWSSSENFGDRISGDMGYLQMADVKSLVDQNTFLKGDATSVTIPAGIFKDCSVALYNMFGYGPGAANDGSSPVARIQTKTDLTVLLARPSRGGPGGGGTRAGAPGEE